MLDISGLLGCELVITEKCDGGNVTYTREGLYARSHSGPPSHPSFNLAKVTAAQIRYQVPENISVFCEYCYAIHSIEYGALPGYSLVFGVRDDSTLTWWDWDSVGAMAGELGLPTVPELYRGVVKTELELLKLTTSLAVQGSSFRGLREGVVVRRAGSFSDEEFPSALGKWVRPNHVQTDDHWMYQAVRAQRLGSSD